MDPIKIISTPKDIAKWCVTLKKIHDELLFYLSKYQEWLGDVDIDTSTKDKIFAMLNGETTADNHNLPMVVQPFNYRDWLRRYNYFKRNLPDMVSNPLVGIYMSTTDALVEIINNFNP